MGGAEVGGQDDVRRGAERQPGGGAPARRGADAGGLHEAGRGERLEAGAEGGPREPGELDELVAGQALAAPEQAEELAGTPGRECRRRSDPRSDPLCTHALESTTSDAFGRQTPDN